MINKKWLQSPFFESRGNYPLDMIVIHHIGSQNNKLYSVKGTLSWFTDINVHRNKETGIIENKVSAHYVLPREQHEGNDLYHLVKDTDIAYHAGESQWIINGKIRKYINRYSIGIEMEGDGNLVEYTPFQYDILTGLIKDLMEQYHIPEANIVGHEDVAPGRKVDPGKYFDWKKLRTMLNPPIVVESAEIPVEKTSVTSEDDVKQTPPPVTPPEPVKPQNPPVEEKFFMGDGSKTHGGLLQFLKLIMDMFFVKSKVS